jgi:hypothetical protein
MSAPASRTTARTGLPAAAAYEQLERALAQRTASPASVYAKTSCVQSVLAAAGY